MGIVKIVIDSFENAAARKNSWNKRYKVLIKKVRFFHCPKTFFTSYCFFIAKLSQTSKLKLQLLAEMVIIS